MQGNESLSPRLFNPTNTIVQILMLHKFEAAIAQLLEHFFGECGNETLFKVAYCKRMPANGDWARDKEEE